MEDSQAATNEARNSQASHSQASTESAEPTAAAPRTKRGSLKVYLGCAPGVGKTYAMLREAHDLQERGHMVLVGYVEHHGRARTEAQLEGLEVLPRKTVHYRGSAYEDMDVEAIIRAHPEVVLVDELAHTVVLGQQEQQPVDAPKRWHDVYELLDAGIDVISTVNIQHLESLNDVVSAVTGTRQRETVPDQVLRDADQVELVDLSPDALRVRLARGEIYDGRRTEAALSNYFRPGNLTALRELSLLWLADKVDEGLQRYRSERDIDQSWPARERVVVAASDSPEAERLIRRGARIAGRKAGRELIVVHIAEDDGLRSSSAMRLKSLQRVTEDLDGEWRVLLGSEVAETLLAFARSVNATQLVVGMGRTSPFSTAGRRSRTIIEGSGGIDVHIVSTQHNTTRARMRRSLPRLATSLSGRRQVLGWVTALALPPLATVVMTSMGLGTEYFGTIVLAYLLFVVVSTLLGGFVPGMVCLIIGSLLGNWYFTEPVHTLNMVRPENIAGVVIYVLIAAAVAWVVELAERRTRQARRNAHFAAILSDLASGVLRDGDNLHKLLQHLGENLGVDRIDLQREQPSGHKWLSIERWDAHDSHATTQTPPAGEKSVVQAGQSLRLVCYGRSLSSSEEAIVEAHGARITAIVNKQEIDAFRRATAALEAGNRVGTAVLTAVSHNLRTPLAGIKAAVSSLKLTDIEIDDATRDDLIDVIDSSADRLNTVVGDLLDMSRLNSHRLEPSVRPVFIPDALYSARAEIPETALPAIEDGSDIPAARRSAEEAIAVDVPENLPPVLADEGLLQRILVNLMSNGLRHAPGSAITVAACVVQDCVELRVVDHGPGIPEEKKRDLFQAFSLVGRSGDDGTGPGLGLGLSVAFGFAEAMGGSLAVEDTPGDGATFVLTLPSTTLSAWRGGSMKTTQQPLQVSESGDSRD
ncbi:Sensor protein KdpD [Corynebacterium ciconiae DSM 44920]|uniref:sensor histidine kinase n=1 Tax=Corynebacterium ciconiae TaxID=227319 RepID=UPI000371E869|nr:ATP-binding protein [Corynebacterium ciconiae]WKD60101.1 Sensor protein KdpD [Corynebacterium ciconiae DSM 44920]